MTVYFGLDAGHETVAGAEHWILSLVAQLGPVQDVRSELVACTHLVHTPWPHVAVSLALPQAPDGWAVPAPDEPLADAAGVARAEHERRASGRAVWFPGVTRVAGVISVAEILAASAIERVTVLGGEPPTPETLVETRDFVRPQWMDGALTLVAMPSVDGRIAPFEVPNPTPCCADHGQPSLSAPCRR